jgi:hypothetical protein
MTKIEFDGSRWFEVSIVDVDEEIGSGSSNALWRLSHAGARYESPESSRSDESVESHGLARNIQT